MLGKADGERATRRVVLFLFEGRASLYLNTGPDRPWGGALVLEPSTEAATIADVERALQRQSLDSLVAAASLGIVGRAVSRPLPHPPVRVNAPCVTVAIDTVLFGTPAGPMIPVYCLSDYVPSEPAVLLLRRDPDGLFHPVGFSAGIMRLSGARFDGRRAKGVELMKAVRGAVTRRERKR
jgi:hypothetical protein